MDKTVQMKQFYVNEIVTSNGVEQGLVHNEKHALHNIGVMYDESPTDELINMMKREAPFMVLKRFEKYLAVISCDQDGFRMKLGRCLREIPTIKGMAYKCH